MNATLAKLFNVRHNQVPFPDLEIVVNYRGAKQPFHGMVEFFCRESMFAGYNVEQNVQNVLTKLEIPFHIPDGKYCNINPQFFVTQQDFEKLQSIQVDL